MKKTTKLIGLFLSVLLIAVVFCGVTAFAAETDYTSPTADEAKIYGANVNLGGDISMKYYVEVGTNITVENLKLKTEFLGVVKELSATSTETIGDTTYHIYVLDSINPQCMGDLIEAQLVYNGEALTCDDSNMNDYSVKQNLVNIYATSDDKTKQLIIDTLEYGAAAQVYQNYKSEETQLVTYGVDFIADGAAASTPSANTYEYSEATESIYLEEVTVNFSNTNQIKIKYVNNAENVTESSVAIAPYDFSEKYTFTVTDGFTLKYSINDYCYEILNGNYTENMKSLASALYNYGLSAHLYVGHDVAPTYAPTADGGQHTVSYSCCGTVVAENHSFDENAHTCVCGKLESYTVSLAYSTCGAQIASVNGVAVNEGDTITVEHGKELTLVLKNTASASREDVYFGPIKIGDANYIPVNSGYPVIENGNTLIFAEGTITGNVVIYADALLSVTIDMAGGSISDTYTHLLTAKDGIATVVDGWAHTGSGMYFARMFNKEGHTLVAITDQSGDIYNTVNSDPKFELAGDLYLTLAWKCNSLTSVAAVEATCTAEGNVAHYKCESCGKNYADAEGTEVLTDVTVSVNPDAHDYPAIPNSYTNDGDTHTEHYICTRDESHIKDVSGVAHNFADGKCVCGAKATPVVTTVPAAVAGLQYTGEAQALVTEGAAEGGEVQYKLGENGTYGTAIPTATEIGTYTVYWKVVGDSDHGDTAEQSITVTISERTVTEDNVTVGGLDVSYTFTGEAITPAITVTVDGNTLTAGTDYDVTVTNNTNVGTATITITFKGNYSGSVTKTFEITQQEETLTFDGEGVKFS